MSPPGRTEPAYRFAYVKLTRSSVLVGYAICAIDTGIDAGGIATAGCTEYGEATIVDTTIM